MMHQETSEGCSDFGNTVMNTRYFCGIGFSPLQWFYILQMVRVL